MSNDGRPIPLHGRLAGPVIDYEVWRRWAYADGECQPHEAMVALPIRLELAPLASEAAETMEHLATCLNGRDGVHSVRARRSMRALLDRCRARVAGEAAADERIAA